MGRLERRVALVAMVALCALPPAGRPALASPRAAAVSAASPDAGTMDGVKTLLRYTSCSMGIARSRDGVGFAAAMLYCVMLFQEAVS